MELNERDRIILNELQKNCRQSSRQLSKKLGIPATTINLQIKRFEKEGIIKGYYAKLDPEKLGFKSLAMVLLQTEHFKPTHPKYKDFTMKDTLKEIAKMPEVLEAYALTGEYDVFLKVVGKSDKEIGTFVVDKLWRVPTARRTLTGVVFFTGKDTSCLPLY